MSSYTYNLGTDFNSGINMNKLYNEIYKQIPKKFIIKIYGNKVNIRFYDNITVGEKSTLDTIINNHQASVISTGSFAKDDAISSTTSSNYQQKLRLVTNYLHGGDYKISWSFSYNHDGQEMDIRIQIDDTNTIHELYWRPIFKDKDYKFHDSGFTIENLSEGIHNIDVDFRGVDRKATTIWNVRLFIEPVA